ncbi:hypothetical protein DFH11DRAFT_1789478 [Phellopilus nigrolimitatus]|nr:hypothetical protein DFH11DRAFT_1789478 [Phellopilus nigrolimitatus]
MQSIFQRDEAGSQILFLELKSICVPLLSHSRLNNREIPKVLSLLSELTIRLQKLDQGHAQLKPALVSYAFFPLSTILSRNESSSIPDQVVEKIFNVLELLFRWWWWTCENAVWEQVVILAGAVIGGLGVKGKGRERDDETKEAAVRLLLCLLRDRSADEDVVEKAPEEVEQARIRLKGLQKHAQTQKLVPILGQTLNALLDTATSEHLALQLASLQAVEVIISLYVPDAVVASILPGVVSTTTRIALGMTSKVPKSKGWVNGSYVVVIRSLGDERCLSCGIVKELNGLEDLTELVSGEAAAALSSHSNTSGSKPYETTRSASWLRASSSQLLIALNTLTSLISHPTVSALLALSSLSQSLLSSARLTLPDARPLLLSFLLSLSNSRFPSVSSHARSALSSLLSPLAKGSHELLQSLLQQTADNLPALPRLLSAHADARIEHVAGQIEAVCRLGVASAGVGRLLGPTGHIEKWGWRLLAVLDFAPPSTTISVAGAGVVGLLGYSGDERAVFPEITLRIVSTRETHAALERMLRALGTAGGEACFFAVEWFVRLGSAERRSASAVAALWCACKILEGVLGVALNDDGAQETLPNGLRGRRVEKLARWLAKTVSEYWDNEEEDEYTETNEHNAPMTSQDEGDEGRPAIEFVKGLTPLQMRFDIQTRVNTTPSGSASRQNQPILHKSLALQLISVSAATLQSHFSPLFMHALYPILHTLVSPDAHLSSTAFAALQHVTRSTGYATPGNLLLSNFDYALDAVSRRLTRRWLDIDAAKVLVVLVRLVGRDVVQRAGDVVEECFDRLDDFHGYAVVVEGLIEALHEVVKVVETEDIALNPVSSPQNEDAKIPDSKRFDNFLHWLEHRKDPPLPNEEDIEVGPAPREAWDKDPPPTPTQALTAKIVSRSITLLTHGSSCDPLAHPHHLRSSPPCTAPGRSSSTASATPRHTSWPAAAALVAALARTHGGFMAPRVWDDVWPRFRGMLARLDDADGASALARRTSRVSGASPVGTESAYTHSHRLYRAMLSTMTAAIRGGVQVQDRHAWDVLIVFRRFLHKSVHEELQTLACQLYVAFGENNEDAVWLVLTSTVSTPGTPHLEHLSETKWDIQDNIDKIFADLSKIQQ